MFTIKHKGLYNNATVTWFYKQTSKFIKERIYQDGTQDVIIGQKRHGGNKYLKLSKVTIRIKGATNWKTMENAFKNNWIRNRGNVEGSARTKSNNLDGISYGAKSRKIQK